MMILCQVTVAQKSVPMFVHFCVIALWQVRAWEYDNTLETHEHCVGLIFFVKCYFRLHRRRGALILGPILFHVQRFTVRSKYEKNLMRLKSL